MIKIPDRLVNECHERGIVVMAGAGVSAAPPSSLPGWNQINEMIVDALCDRIEDYLEHSGYTKELRQRIHERRSASQFPPDFQAQLLEESCGEDYFRALQSLDISLVNSAHMAIARLARHGVLSAIVTTNFDCLIEKALDAAGVEHEVAFEPESYKRCASRLTSGHGKLPIQILKLHGSVQEAPSMIDTLKQRRLGRNRHLMECVESLLGSHLWLYLGFSAADLETDRDYLGILGAAARSPGLVYTQWPGTKELGPGARLMTGAYGQMADVVVAELDELLPALATELQVPELLEPELAKGESDDLVRVSLTTWASGLHPADAFVCLAGLAEAAGEATVAFELLHRFWRSHAPHDRDGDKFERFRLAHGRLGMGVGIMSIVDDLGSNRGMESIQNLLRVSAEDPRAPAWAGLALVWAGQVNDGMAQLLASEPAITQSSTLLETKVDVWLALAQALYLTAESDEFVQHWGAANQWALDAGDLPRQASVAAFHLLVIAEFAPGLYEGFRSEYAMPILEESRRLNHPSIAGFDALARGRRATKERQPDEAMKHLATALAHLDQAGHYPWCLFAKIEYAKAFMDAGRLEESAELLDHINGIVDRYQLMLPWYQEARGQHHILVGRPDIATEAFQQAFDYAEQMGLKRRAGMYREYLEHLIGG